MTLLLAAAAAPVHSFIVLLVLLLVAIALIGLVHVVASHFLPPPWPTVLVGIAALVVVIWLLLWVAG